MRRGGRENAGKTPHPKPLPVNLRELSLGVYDWGVKIKSVGKFIVRNIFWLITAIVIPLVTVGYDYLEQTNFYNRITLTTELKEAVNEVYSGDEKSNGFLSSQDPNTGRNFELILKIIDKKDFSSEYLYPQFIFKFSVTNAAYVSVPGNLDGNAKFLDRQTSTSSIIYTGTDDSPTVIYYCPRIIRLKSDFNECRIQKVGDRAALNDLIEDRKNKIRQNFNFAISLLSICISVTLNRKQNKNN